MDLERERRLNELLAEVLDQPTEARRRFLDTVCKEPTLRSEIWSLIGLDAELSGFLQQPDLAGLGEPASDDETDFLETEALDPESFLDDDRPRRIGPFRLLEILGEGGMGRVYLAEQHQPVERRVALKLMRSSLATGEAKLRFEAERQALARLGHPNIAQLFEAATTEEGRPYIAMEYVEGSAITSYCDHHRLGIDDRLALFIDICHGVQHAHQKQLLHRDLKPSNILVAEVDGRPVPKIIDFGIVKALDRPLVDATLATGRRIIGTPAYMSPEALRGLGTPGDLDTRSDVYSLGVLLYELLTGTRPYDVGDDPLGQVLQKISQGEPARPSTHVGSLDSERRQTLADRRSLEATALGRRLRGDLDSVVMKAIAHDRDERYPSVAELAGDLERYREDLPVMARSATGLYALRKLVRRHRLTVGGLALGLVALLVAVGGLGLGLNRARSAELQAKAEAERTEAARSEAQALADFLLGLFKKTSPYDTSGEPKAADQLTALDLLSRGAAQAAVELEDQPLVRARLLEAIGVSYKELGFRSEAREQLEAALELRRAELGDSHYQVAESHNYLGQMALKDYDLEIAQAHFDAALDLLDRLPPTAAPPDTEGADPVFGERVTALDGLGRIARRRGDYAEAERRQKQALVLAETGRWPDRSVEAKALTNLAVVYTRQERFEAAEPLYRQARDLFSEVAPPGHPVLLQLTGNVAFTLNHLGRFDEARDELLAVLPGARSGLGETHPLLATLLLELAAAENGLSRASEAESLARQALEIRTATYGAKNPETVEVSQALAAILLAQGRVSEAGDLLREGYSALEEVLGPDHPDLVRNLEAQAEADLAGDRPDLAVLKLERALALSEAHFDSGHTRTEQVRGALERARSLADPSSEEI